MDWSELIKDYRQRHAMTQAALAEFLNVDPTTVSRWERGRDEPSLSIKRKLREIFGQGSSQIDRALKDLIDNTDDIAVLMNRNYEIVAASRPHRRMLRYDLPDIQGVRFPFWTDAMHQIIGHAGGPEGWWKNGIYRMDFMSIRKPGERARNTEMLYQSVTTLTLRDSTGEPLRYSVTKRIPVQQFKPGPPILTAF